MRIDEHSLTEFRRRHLSPAELLALVVRHVLVLVRLAIGVGKSTAADELLASQATYEQFPLVVYLAPSWAIIHERAIVNGTTPSPVPCLIVRSRPTERCGPLDAEWKDLEQRGCGVFAKATLCRNCPEASAPKDPCTWPQQLRGIENIRLVMATEQQLVFNRALILLLVRRSCAGRALVIVDEGRSLDANFEVVLTEEELVRFEKAVRQAGNSKGFGRGLIHEVSEVVARLVQVECGGLASERFSISPYLSHHAFMIQGAGLDLFGPSFRYIGYDLVQLQWSERDSRWKDGQGDIHFTARPYLRCHVLFLSAHLTGEYVGHRLGQGPVESPYEKVEFLHTGTRFFNLKNRIGADRYFKKNSQQILDTIAVLVACNVFESRTTLIVSRKKSKDLVGRYLTERLAGWGLAVRFVGGDYRSLPTSPDPLVIPLLHYGILGVNDFESYESAYCANGYYVSDRELNRAVQEAEPDTFRVRLEIESGPGMVRRVRVVPRGLPATGDLVGLGNQYLRRLEVDPVVQAVGRVRFVTRPREVVTFQMNDLAGDVSGVQDVRSLADLRRALKVPNAREVDQVVRGTHARQLMSTGLSAEEAGHRLGLSRRSVFRVLKAAESANIPLSILKRESGTLSVRSADREARS